MINSTFLSLNVISIMSMSPFFIVHNNHNGIIISSFYNIHMSRCFSNILVSSTAKHQTLFKNCYISNILNSAIKLSNECPIDFEKGNPINSKTFQSSQLTFNGDCGNITIVDCTFNNCQSSTYGGSLYIEQDCYVIIHGTVFKRVKQVQI